MRIVCVMMWREQRQKTKATPERGLPITPGPEVPVYTPPAPANFRD